MIHARGLLRHHFWGEYGATVALEFASAELAALALPALEPLGFTLPTNERVMVTTEFGKDYQTLECGLVALGADIDKLTSLKYSIDRGEIFTIAVPVDDHTTQEALF